jgi:NodT family efflux transporter outer membrane factor (OMF) lipoprotein
MRVHRRLRRSRLALAAMALLTAGGCAVGPDFQRPEAPSADRYTAHALRIEAAPEAGSAAQYLALDAQLGREWWQLFESDALDDLVQRALAGNRTLAAAAATLAQAQALADAGDGARAPQVDLTAGIGREKYGAEFLGSLPRPPPFTYFAVGPRVSYALDYTGGLARAAERQYALAEYRRQQLAAACLTVSGSAVMHALEIASLRAQIAAVEEVLARDRERAKLEQTAVNLGSSARLDVVSAESQLAADATLLPPLRQSLALARDALALVLGQPPAGAVLPELELNQLVLPQRLPVSVPAELAHRRPDILAAEAQLHAATAAVGIADARLYPRIDLTASTGQQAIEFGDLARSGSNAFSLAAALVAPLFDGGTLRAEERAAAAAMQASAANYEQTVLVAFAQVADTLQALEHDQEAVDAQMNAQRAAREEADLAALSHREGNSGLLPVLDAERSYEQAKLGLVRAQAQRYLDTVQLFLALGGAAPEHP